MTHDVFYRFYGMLIRLQHLYKLVVQNLMLWCRMALGDLLRLGSVEWRESPHEKECSKPPTSWILPATPACLMIIIWLIDLRGTLCVDVLNMCTGLNVTDFMLLHF